MGAVCLVCLCNLQTFALYPLYSTAFATALLKGVDAFVFYKFCNFQTPDPAPLLDAAPSTSTPKPKGRGSSPKKLKR